jgi:flagellar FliL protein
MAKKKEKEEVVDEKEGKKPKKSKFKLIITAVAVLLLGGGGYFGWSMYKQKGNEAKTETEEEKKVSVVHPLQSFIVNLADKKGMGKRYLKVTIEVEVENENNRLKVENNTAQIRDTVLLLLSGKQITEIDTMEGKLDLKQALLLRMNRILGEGIIKRIYFSEFVVQ